MFCQSLALINKHYKQWNRTKILREVSHYGKTRMNVAMFVLHRGHLDPMSVTRWAQRSQKRVWTQHTETHSHTARQRASKCRIMPHVDARRCTSTHVKNDASCRTSTHIHARAAWCVMMRHVASKTPQKSNQFWFLHYVTHVNVRWRAIW